MDHFERELARMMRDGEEPTPFEARHGERLRAGVRHRRRIRAARRAAGSVLAVAGLCLALFLLPQGPSQVEPADHDPLPTVTTTPWTSAPPGTPDATPSGPSSSATTGAPTYTSGDSATTTPPTAPVTTGAATGTSSSSTSPPPTGGSTSPPPTGTATWQSDSPPVSTSLVTP
ncbi:hypothetical protein [Streptomyces sp. 351MFTsu5.1]|uniref:hypothetical protein n=1 Tax=Streptomyces sp. 351MFTsu5.1 TaxID=1172180 RepID=UPI0003A28ED6|nr:hypothetical protein [Streptomyces sp. 351MFTsu5.1]